MVNRDSSSREVEAVIARLVAAEFGDGDAASRAQLRAHVAQDPARAEIERSALALWDALGELDPPAALLRTEPRRSRLWLAIAAAVLPFLLIAGLTLTSMDPFAPAPWRAELAAGPAERRIVSLPDGSSVSLSAESRVSVDLRKGRRSLVLQRGEALFRVAHDARRPFLVAAGDGVIRAVGTAFNVRLGRRGVVVTVTEGRVRISARDATTANGFDSTIEQVADAGQQVRFGREQDKGGGTFMTPPVEVDADRYTSWADGVLRFEGEPLAEVIDEVNRYSARRIELRDPGLRDLPIYGVLHIGDVEGLRSIVADIQRLEAEAASEKLAITAENAGT